MPSQTCIWRWSFIFSPDCLIMIKKSLKSGGEPGIGSKVFIVHFGVRSLLRRTRRWWRGTTPHLVSVDVVQSVEQHLHDLLDLCECKLYIGVAQQPGQVVLTEVKHQVDAAFVSVVLSSFKNNDKSKLKNQKKTLLGLRKHLGVANVRWRTDMDVWHQPLVLQISIRLTTFSCLSSCKILISLRAVIGNWNKERPL